MLVFLTFYLLCFLRLKYVHKTRMLLCSPQLAVGKCFVYNSLFLFSFLTCLPSCNSPRGQLLTWEWFKTNYDKIVECFQVGFILPRVIEVCHTYYDCQMQVYAKYVCQIHSQDMLCNCQCIMTVSMLFILVSCLIGCCNGFYW